MKYNKILASFILWAVWTSVRGQEVLLTCEVVELQELSRDGRVIRGQNYQTEQIGDTFTVNVNSGEITGNYFINNDNDLSTEVINQGNSDTLYVISKSHGPSVYVSYLSIFTFLDEDRPPFTFTASGRYIYTGYCQ